MKHICRVCRNSEGNTTYQAKEMMFGFRDVFDYFQCVNCGCLQISNFPSDISKYYPQGYYSFDSYDGKKFRGFKGAIKKKQYQYSVLGGVFFKKLFGKKEYKIFKGLNVSRETRILDVGCGNGRNFQYPLAEIGFRNLKGCDPYLTEQIDYSNGLTIYNKQIFDIQGVWDIITYHHAFEHISDPLENLMKVHELLSDDGVCIIRIPTVSSFAWEHYRTNWVQLDAPRHFFLHSKESIQLLAEQAGLKLIKVVYDSYHFQFIGSEKYNKDIPLSDPKKKGVFASLKRKWLKYKYQRKSNELNQKHLGDQAAFFFQKK